MEDKPWKKSENLQQKVLFKYSTGVYKDFIRVVSQY